MAYNSFPYVNMHELNLDYLLNKSKEVQSNVEAAAGSASAAASSATAAAGSADASLTYSRNSANSAAASEASAADSAESARIAVAAAGDPVTFTAASQLTNTSKIYVYIGETGTYTYGHWYYYAGGAWIDGGVYGTWTTDAALDPDSTNAVQNKVIYNAVSELQSDVTKNDEILNSAFLIVDNMLYDDRGFTDWGALASFDGDNIIISAYATVAANSYASAQKILDVRNIDNVCIHWESITGDEGTNPRIRYGSTTSMSGTSTWIGFATNGQVIDVSGIDYLVVALYVYFNRPTVEGNSATYSKLQLETGTTAHEFTMTAKAIKLLIPSGNLFYYGDRIRIGALKDENQCTIETWLNVENNTDYDWYKSQGLEIYNNYVFDFLDAGETIVIDETTKAAIGTFTLSVSSNHQNSAQFTNVFLDGAEFPLVLLSRCGNAHTSSASPLPGTDAGILANITRSGNVFSCALRTTVALDVPTWGSSWAIDNKQQYLYVAAYFNGNYNVTDNNPVIIYKFVCPDNIKTGGPFTLHIADALQKITLDHFILQSVYAVNDYLFMPAQDSGGNWVYVVSLSQSMITSKIPIDATFEPEGLTVQDGTVYVSMRRGTDTAGANPFRIVKITIP